MHYALYALFAFYKRLQNGMEMNQHGMKSSKDAILVPQFEITSLIDLG